MTSTNLREIGGILFLYRDLMKNHLRIAVIDYNVTTRYFPDISRTRNIDAWQTITSSLPHHPLSPRVPPSPPSLALLQPRFCVSVSLWRDFDSDAIEELDRGERGRIHPRSTSAEKHIARLNRARGATKVSVRSRLTANFGTSKSDFPHAWASALSRDHARRGLARGGRGPRVGATCRHVWSAVWRYTIGDRPVPVVRLPVIHLPLFLSLSLSLSDSILRREK